ncbi:PREDICTED: acyl-CoA--sterol O-acyltransferase 1-like [Ipomoea nil]|uniref:acyl-CoA--sterol O-acyltransferase 1-like n=1 Tax=Ipomoea nil TaxID=35883 RepID=UPI0009010101|nr:PREDICTED: acyl-CoA--sterol O-acyltransferase 1-like [Ipomoea nil]
MEGEINNFIMVWTTVLCCLCYCHTINGLFPKPSFTRFFAIFPVACLFLVLPLNLTSIHLAGTSAFFIGWLGSFKLTLFALCRGPLSSTPPLPLSTFIPFACLPIKVQRRKKVAGNFKFSGSLRKLVLLGVVFLVYYYKEFLHPKVFLLFFVIHLYIVLEFMLFMVSGLVRAVFRVELEAPFDEPHLSTSLQDFWGRRWNVMVTNILRPTVYDPVRSVSARFLPESLASLPAVMASFVVSGIMHELVFYNIGRATPTGEVMSFFLVNGACVALEIGVKRAVDGKFRLPGIVSGPLALTLVILTSFWLFFPPYFRNKGDTKACAESLAFIEFVINHRLVSPESMTCQFFSISI